jgi:dCMP deaminase
MDMAILVAQRSKDPSTKVGCVVVSEDKIVVATGYNGLPRGVQDRSERMERPAKYLWTSHAEENAVAQSARVGAKLKGGTAFVTHHPCSRCARSLIQAGITRVVIGGGKTSMPDEEFEVARIMFKEAGVNVR